MRKSQLLKWKEKKREGGREEKEREMPSQFQLFNLSQQRHQTWELGNFLECSNPNRYSMNRRATQLISAQIVEL